MMVFILGVAMTFPLTGNAATTVGKKLEGQFLIEVDNGGRLWYVDPSTHSKYEVNNKNVKNLFQELSVGVANEDLEKIPLAFNAAPIDKDSDGDGWSNRTEVSEGYDPFGPGKPNYDRNFAFDLAGELLLQVEDDGRIWYVDTNGERWELTWENYLNVMSKNALGVLSQDISEIPTRKLDVTTTVTANESHDENNTKGYLQTSLNQELNKYRLANNLPIIFETRETCSIAQKRIEEIVHNQSNHAGLDRKIASDNKMPVAYDAVTENLWNGDDTYTDNQVIVDWSLNSNHKVNLEADWNAGCGFRYGPHAVYVFMNK